MRRIEFMGPPRREGQPLVDWLRQTRVDEENAVRLAVLLGAGAILSMVAGRLVIVGLSALVSALLG